MYTRSQLKDILATLLAGHATEDIIFNERTSGPHADIKQATDYARRMVVDFGMSDELGPRTFGDRQEMVFLGREISEQRDYSERFALEIDREVNKLIKEGYDTAKRILTENKQKLVQIAERLIAEETLEGEDLDALLSDSVDSIPQESPPKTAPAPAEATTKEAKPRRKAKKTSIIPGPLPKQAPAMPD